MSSTISMKSIRSWCQVHPDRLETHPNSRMPIRILSSPEDVHKWAATEMVAEIKRNNDAKKPTKWILPCGPTAQYRRFTESVNRERISLRDLHVFHMDDYLDWQGRHLPLEHPFSMEGWMRRNFYGAIDPKLTVPETQRHFPSIHDLDGLSRSLEEVGGADTAFGGVGYHGHIAFNEPPLSPWHSISVEEFRSSKTRILELNDDTIIARSQRDAGGCSHIVPPMAITMGMADILAARRIRLIVETGSWKQTVVRIMLFSEPTVEYPGTLVQGHRDVLVVVDRATADNPFDQGGLG